MLRPVMNHRLMQLLPLLMPGMQETFERGLRKGLESTGSDRDLRVPHPLQLPVSDASLPEQRSVFLFLPGVLGAPVPA